MQDVRIRRLGTSEWREYRALRLRALQDAPEAFSSTWAEARHFADTEWMQRTARADSALELPLIAEVNETWVGLLWARIESTDGSLAQLYQMWVAPECRSRGIARGLMEAALAWCAEQGVATVLLGVTDGERPARHLYESVGFVALDEVERLRDDSPLMVRTMMLKLRCI